MPAIPILGAVGSFVGAGAAASTMAVVVGGAIVGAAVGAVVAAVTGGDILKGALMGGLVGGGVGAVGALTGAAGAAGSVTASAPATTGYGAGLIAPAATTVAPAATTAGLTAGQTMAITAVGGAAEAYSASESEKSRLESAEKDRLAAENVRNTPIPEVSIGKATVSNTNVDPRERYAQTVKDLTSMVAAPTVEKPQVSAPGALDVA